MTCNFSRSLTFSCCLLLVVIHLGFLSEFHRDLLSTSDISLDTFKTTDFLIWLRSDKYIFINCMYKIYRHFTGILVQIRTLSQVVCIEANNASAPV